MDLALAFKLTVADRASSGLRAAATATAKVGEVAKAAGERWKASGEQISQVGQKVSAVAQQIQSGLQSILAPASGVEEAMAQLQQSLGADGASMTATLASVKEAALAWADEHRGSAESYIAASKQMVAAGIGEANVVAATNAALRLQAVAGGDAAKVGQTLGVVYNQLGNKTRPAAEELDRLGDILAKAKQLYPTIDIAELTDPLKDAGPAAKAAGVSFEALTATLGQLNAAGLKGGEAGAKLAEVMASLGPGTQKVGLAMAKTADGGVDLVGTLAAIEKRFGAVDKMTPETRKKLEEAFGPGAFKTLTMLLGQTDKLSTSFEAISGSAGTAAAAQKALESTTTAQAQIASQALDGLKIEIAAGIAPALQELLPEVRSVIAEFKGFVKAHPDLVKTAGKIAILVAAVLAVVGPVLVATGALLTFAGFLMATVVPALAAAASGALAFAAALLANPITWIVIAIVALAVLLYVYWEPISAFFLAIWAKISAAFSKAAALMREVWTAAKTAVMSIFSDIKVAFQGSFINGVIAVMALLNPGAILGRVFAAVLPILARVWQSVIDGIHAAAASAISAVGEWWQGVINRLHAAGNSIRTGLAETWAGVRTDIYAAFAAVGAWFEETFLGGIRSDLDSVRDAVANFSLLDAGRNIINTLVEGMRAAANLPAETMQGVVQQVRDYLPFSPAKRGPLRDLHRVKLIETVASSVNAEPLVAAMAGATSQAYAAVSSPPSTPAIPLSMSSASGSAPANVSVTLNFGGTPDASVVAQLEAWIADPANAMAVARAATRGQQRDERARF